MDIHELSAIIEGVKKKLTEAEDEILRAIKENRRVNEYKESYVTTLYDVMKQINELRNRLL